MKKILFLALLLTGCVGPDSWNKEPWQREVFNQPADKLIHCVADALNGHNVSHVPGSDTYSLTTYTGNVIISPLSRADFRQIGQRRTEVSTYGQAYWFGPIPNHSLEVIKAARLCESTGMGAR